MFKKIWAWICSFLSGEDFDDESESVEGLTEEFQDPAEELVAEAGGNPDDSAPPAQPQPQPQPTPAPARTSPFSYSAKAPNYFAPNCWLNRIPRSGEAKYDELYCVKWWTQAKEGEQVLIYDNLEEVWRALISQGYDEKTASDTVKQWTTDGTLYCRAAKVRDGQISEEPVPEEEGKKLVAAFNAIHEDAFSAAEAAAKAKRQQNEKKIGESIKDIMGKLGDDDKKRMYLSRLTPAHRDVAMGILEGHDFELLLDITNPKSDTPAS